jgi:hypothetical protein
MKTYPLIGQPGLKTENKQNPAKYNEIQQFTTLVSANNC